MNNPKVNYTQEDNLKYVQNMYVKLIVERDHPEIIERAKRLAKKFMKQNVDK